MHMSHFNLNLSPLFFVSPTNSTAITGAAPGQSQTTWMFYPENVQLRFTHLEVNLGLYGLLGVVAIANLVWFGLVKMERFNVYEKQVRTTFYLQAYLALSFLCYSSVAEDVIVRLYSGLTSSSMEMFICLGALAVFVLQPVYLIPAMLYIDKEPHQTDAGYLPLSFIYRSFVINSRPHFVL